MTRKIQQPSVEEGKSRKRVLKPVVEKKRRDRINQSLAELRSLLLNNTSDPRLKNPKIEKAEILDLAVEYLRSWTDEKNLSNVSADVTRTHMKARAPVLNLHPSDSSAPSLFTIEGAGFQQCVAQLTSYMHRITPAQRTNLIEGLRHHTESQRSHDAKPKPEPERDATKVPDATSVEAICTSERRGESPKLFFPAHSPFQPHSCSTPSHDYLSPPPSPWLSPSFSTYATSSPPFPSFASHFSFPPSLSPPSSNTSFFSFSPTVPHSNPPVTLTLRPPPHLAQREGSPPHPSSPMWRPW